ncbi:FixJ family two-component response regulator [Bosea sp. OAE752]
MSMHKYVVAVVDDDPRLLESLEDLLESAGYAVRGFPSATALTGAGLSGLDLLITDIGLPGFDGFELRDLVNRERPDLPVFLITGRHEIADQIRARAVESFFCKPFDGQALLAAIARALHQ